jgi:hypothetical protein
VNAPKYRKLLTPEEYAKLTLDEQAEYIVDMATFLKSLPAPHPPPDETHPAQEDPPAGNAPTPAQDDPPAVNAPGPAQDEPPASTDKPKEP